MGAKNPLPKYNVVLEILLDVISLSLSSSLPEKKTQKTLKTFLEF